MQKFNNETEFIFSNEFVGFTTIPNYIFQCKELSYRAVGVYCSILQFQNSPSHSITIKGLSSNHKEGRDAVAKAIDELIKTGFLEKIQARENGKFKGMLYKVYMKPIDTQRISPITEKPVTENPKPKNPTHKNKIDKKENLNNKNKSTTRIKKDSNESVVVDSSNKSIVESQTILKLTHYQSKTVASWNIEKLNRAIEIFNIQDGQTFSLLLKIYRAGAVNNLTNTTMTMQKVNKFNEMDSREWDFEEMERLEREYIDRKLQENIEY